MRINLKAKPRDSARVSVIVDDTWFCPLSLNLVASLKLSARKRLNCQDLTGILLASLTEQYYHTALRRLAHRPQSIRELTAKLVRYRRLRYNKKFTSQLITQTELENLIGQARQAALQTLQEKNYLNDTEFARWWVEQRLKGCKPKGLKFISLELRQKGIDSRTISTAISQIDPQLELHQARAYRQKLLQNSIQPKKMPTWQQKCYLKKRLYARGFSSTVINQILN